MKIALVSLMAGFLLVEPALAQTELLLVVGEEREITPPFAVARATVEDPSICDATLHQGKTVVLVARRAGTSAVKLLDGADQVRAQYRLEVFASQQALLRHDVAALLGGIGGVQVSLDGDRVVMKGEARSLDELKRVRDVAREFSDLLDLVALAPAGGKPAPAEPPKPRVTVIHLGDLTLRVPDSPGWSLVESSEGFRAEHEKSGARVQGSLSRLSRGKRFADAELELLAERPPLVLESRALRLGEHEASLLSFVDPEGKLGYRLSATATPFPVNLEYVVIEGLFPPDGVSAGESFFSALLESAGGPRLDPPPGVPYPHRRAGFLVRYPAGWTVGGETAERAGFYQNPDNRPVVNVTVERLPGSYAGEAGLARAGALLFTRARSRGGFRVESEEAPAAGKPWSRLIFFDRGRPLRQKQVVLVFDQTAFALVYTAEPELFATYGGAFSALVESFRNAP